MESYSLHVIYVIQVIRSSISLMSPFDLVIGGCKILLQDSSIVGFNFVKEIRLFITLQITCFFPYIFIQKLKLLIKCYLLVCLIFNVNG